MFDDKCRTIKIADLEVPVKFDLYVLEKMQKKYGTLNEYEQKLKGFRYESVPVEKDSEQKKEVAPVQQKKVMKFCDPDVAAILATIPFMIAEGIEIEGDELQRIKGVDFSVIGSMSEKQLVQNIKTPYYTLVDLVQQEFTSCFEIDKKKLKATRTEKTRQ